MKGNGKRTITRMLAASEQGVLSAEVVQEPPAVCLDDHMQLLVNSPLLTDASSVETAGSGV